VIEHAIFSSEEAKDMDLLLNTWASFSSFVVEAAVGEY
jgi:hypothetical protein